MVDVHQILSECPLFREVSAEALVHLAEKAVPVRLRAGDVLFDAGSAGDELFIVASGRMRVVAPEGRIIGEIARLEPIGEIGVLTGQQRNASVVALRDSLLYRFSREDFHRFGIAEPAALMAITRIIMSRLLEPGREGKLRQARKVRTFSVIAAAPGVSATALAEQLHQALPGSLLVGEKDAVRELGSVEHERLAEWLSQIEFTHPRVIYDTSGSGRWQQIALRQADRVLAVLPAATEAAPDTVLAVLRRVGLQAPVDLVLERRPGESAAAVLPFKQALGAAAHYFIRPQQAEDIAALARQLTGHSIGLVLGSGGARGFVHVGLIRALKELGIQIDHCGGTSMGALVGAMLAAGFDEARMLKTLRATFLKRKLLNDYRWPSVSIIAGRKIQRHLRGVFGDLRIEHLQMPYYCVTTNLTHARSEAHHEGPLADWLCATMCIPGLAPPVAWKGSLLVDGAVVNSVPTDVMQNLGRGLIIASDVSTDGTIRAPRITGPDPDFDVIYEDNGNGERVSMLGVMFRAAELGAGGDLTTRERGADHYIRMPVASVSTFAWNRIDELVELGYRHAMTTLPAFLERQQDSEEIVRLAAS